MGIIQLDAYVLLVSGHDRFSFLDGFQRTKSINLAVQFSRPHLQKSSMSLMSLRWENLAIVGYGPYKEDVLAHLQPRILQQNVIIRDISSLNNVYVSTEEYAAVQNVTD